MCSNPRLAELTGAPQVRGNIVYVKRGGCSFTQKARMAQQAGAIAMVVANTDRETVSLSPPPQPSSNAHLLWLSLLAYANTQVQRREERPVTLGRVEGVTTFPLCAVRHVLHRRRRAF